MIILNWLFAFKINCCQHYRDACNGCNRMNRHFAQIWFSFLWYCPDSLCYKWMHWNFRLASDDLTWTWILIQRKMRMYFVLMTFYFFPYEIHHRHIILLDLCRTMHCIYSTLHFIWAGLVHAEIYLIVNDFTWIWIFHSKMFR